MQQKEFYDRVYIKSLDIEEEAGKKAQDLTMQALPDIHGKRILEVGCGTGSKFEFLIADNDYYGIDIAEEALARAKARGIKVVMRDVQKQLPFKDNFFDLVICSEVFEHILEPLDTLKECWRLLKDDGIFFCTVPNHFTIKNRLAMLLGKGIEGDMDFFRDRFPEWQYPHLRFFTWNGFREFLKTGGFHILKNYSYLLPHVPHLVSTKKILGVELFMPVNKLFDLIVFEWLRRSYTASFCASFWLQCRKD